MFSNSFPDNSVTKLTFIPNNTERSSSLNNTDPSSAWHLIISKSIKAAKLGNCPDVNCSYIAKTNCMIMSHYANIHLADITKRCKEHSCCINCSRTEAITPYHIAKCHPLSPFSK